MSQPQRLALDIEDFYRTDNMALVTFLKLTGHSVQKASWEDGTCYWVFRASDTLLDDVDEFMAGEARVEPREYNKVFTQTKKEFYHTKPQ